VLRLLVVFKLNTTINRNANPGISGAGRIWHHH